MAIESIEPDDDALRDLKMFSERRQAALWSSDGEKRSCCEAESVHQEPSGLVRRRYDPALRLAVVGSDPFALAIAGLGRTLSWDVSLLSPLGPSGPPPFGIACDRRALSVSLAELPLDRWTAVAVATHDLELDHQALAIALASPAAYVGVLGSRRKLGHRLAALKDAGLTEGEIARLRAPIGLPIDALSPWEVAVAVTAEIIESSRAMPTRRMDGQLDLHVTV